MKELMDLILESIINYFYKLWEKISENPLKNLLIIVISILLIRAMAEAIIPFGIFPTIAYVITCIYGFTKIVDDYIRPIAWGLGFVIGTQATNLVVNSLIPQLTEGTAVSFISAMFILYVIIIIYFKARELKGY